MESATDSGTSSGPPSPTAVAEAPSAAPPPPPHAQAEQIAAAEAGPLAEGDRVYLIASAWWHEWRAYSGYNGGSVSDNNSAAETAETAAGASAEPPGRIDNRPLLENGGTMQLTASGLSQPALKPELEEGRHYAVVQSDSWTLLQRWYGGGPAIERTAVLEGLAPNSKKPRINLYPMRLEVWCHTEKEPKYLEADAGGTVAELKSRACALFKVQEGDVRIWDFFQHSKYKDLEASLDQKLTDARIMEDQPMLLEDKDAPEEDARGPPPVIQLGMNSSGAAAGSPRFGSGRAGAFRLGLTEDSINERANARPGLAGLQNLGNTCFMNSSLQCLMHAVPVLKFFLTGAFESDVNTTNPLGMKGELAHAFGKLVAQLWRGGVGAVVPRGFKSSLASFAPQFSGYQQHDSQEFLAFLLDGLHEDVNRIRVKPYVEEKDAGDRPDAEVAAEAWANYRKRNDSAVVDHFQGLYKSTLVCPDCSYRSVKFDPFMYLTVPLPESRVRQVLAILVWMDGTQVPKEYGLEVPHSGTLRDLYSALNTAANLGLTAPERHMAAGRLFTGYSYRLETHRDPKARLSEVGSGALGSGRGGGGGGGGDAGAPLLVYYYPREEDGPANGNRAVVVYHRKRASPSKPRFGHSASDFFSAPLLLFPGPEGLWGRESDGIAAPTAADASASGSGGGSPPGSGDEDGKIVEEEEESVKRARGSQRRAEEGWRAVLRERPAAGRDGGRREFLVVREAPLWRAVARALQPFKLPGPGMLEMAQPSLTAPPEDDTTNGQDPQQQQQQQQKAAGAGAPAASAPAGGDLDMASPRAAAPPLITARAEDGVRGGDDDADADYLGWGPVEEATAAAAAAAAGSALKSPGGTWGSSPGLSDRAAALAATRGGGGAAGTRGNEEEEEEDGEANSTAAAGPGSGAGLDDIGGLEDVGTLADVDDEMEDAAAASAAAALCDDGDDGSGSAAAAGLRPATPDAAPPAPPLAAPFDMWAAQTAAAAATAAPVGAAAAEGVDAAPYVLKVASDRVDTEFTRTSVLPDPAAAGAREPLSFVIDWAIFDGRQTTRGELRAQAAATAAEGGEGAEPPGAWLAGQTAQDGASDGRSDAQAVTAVGGYVVSDMEQPAHDPSAAALRDRATQPRSVSLQQCVEAFLQPEQLEEGDEWYCPRCKKHVQADKKLDLWTLPEVLVVHLKRFSYTRWHRDKIDTQVAFPLSQLDLSPYLLSWMPGQGAPLYDCFAVSNHYGGMGGGHYTAYVKMPDDGGWYCFDDSRVEPVTSDEVTSRAAYVLFYRRRDAAAADPQDLVPQLLEAHSQHCKQKEAAAAAAEAETAAAAAAAGAAAAAAAAAQPEVAAGEVVAAAAGGDAMEVEGTSLAAAEDGQQQQQQRDQAAPVTPAAGNSAAPAAPLLGLGFSGQFLEAAEQQPLRSPPLRPADSTGSSRSTGGVSTSSEDGSSSRPGAVRLAAAAAQGGADLL